ncbi:regulatory protein RecX [Qipengyuania sp. MTN3-11]|uniref:regulatory protein RecX n=1 Tax=Qipengyuania sp. MTN3-11 TaxID=3056557 RepID=UPI0036F35726
MDHSRPSRRRNSRTAKPLDRAALKDLAMAYVARYATTSGKLGQYLRRKLRERDWIGDDAPEVDGLVAEFVERGFVDDEGWAQARAANLSSRGYGRRRIGESLRAAGIGETIREGTAPGEGEAREAAVRLARRRRFGPFGEPLAGEDGAKRRDKQLAAMARAGHDFAHARRVIESPGEDDLANWIAEAESDEDTAR